MILIAPDKYRGTMSARLACHIIEETIGHTVPRMADRLRSLPMADGGEGTAACIGSDAGWVDMGRYRYNKFIGESVIESAKVIGHDNFVGITPADRTSEALGHIVNKIWHNHRPRRIYIGIGGTGCCDGGEGFLRIVDRAAAKVIVGLVDVQVPLLPTVPGGPSALMFAPQKGFTPDTIPALTNRLEMVVRQYGPAMSPFDGAGGGMGYALASVLGCKCYPGAEWIIDHANIDWNNIDVVITGEGKYDRQSKFGKVVDIVHRRAADHNIPTVVFAGTVEKGISTDSNLFDIVDCSKYAPHTDLTPVTARERLCNAVSVWTNDFYNKNGKD